MERCVHRQVLEDYLNETLETLRFEDYGPNGLQLEGRDIIKRVAFAVSATKDSISKAVEWGADALIVHHGLFWSFSGVKPLIGPFAQRIFPLVRHEINLLAYHLPLDAHPLYGNAVGLAHRLGLSALLPFGDYKGMPLGVQGVLDQPMAATELQSAIADVVKHSVMMATPDPFAPVRSMGIITGGANREWRQALKAGLDAYVTGEMSEHDWHESQEAGVHMFAAGHHATEVFGVQSLMALLAGRWGLECLYIESANPA